jgi:hypothetical protein
MAKDTMHGDLSVDDPGKDDPADRGHVLAGEISISTFGLR